MRSTLRVCSTHLEQHICPIAIDLYSPLKSLAYAMLWTCDGARNEIMCTA